MGNVNVNNNNIRTSDVVSTTKLDTIQIQAAHRRRFSPTRRADEAREKAMKLLSRYQDIPTRETKLANADLSKENLSISDRIILGF